MNFTFKIVKYYTLFNSQDLVFSSTNPNYISQIRECPAPPPPRPHTHTSKRAPLFFTIGKFNINIDSIVLHLLLKHHKLKKGSHPRVTTLLNVRTRGAEQWLFTLRINNCSCKAENMTCMVADSPA